MANQYTNPRRHNPYDDVEAGYDNFQGPDNRHHENALQSQRYEPPAIVNYAQNGLPFVQSNGLPPSQAYGGTNATPHPTVLTKEVFLARIVSVEKDIEDLSIYITQISTLHQRAITSTDSSSSTALESTIAQTQVLNTRIRDQIRYLETDAARSGGNKLKNSQIRSVKNQFKNRIEQFQQAEADYRERYQQQIARQYLVVHPDADEAEVLEASQADWGDEGVFQAAVSSVTI
jgi:syntaxin 1B/2/3